MSAVETGETGATSVPIPPLTDYGVGVPFKKRRFLFIQPPSPLLSHKESSNGMLMEHLPISHGPEVPKSCVALEFPPSYIEEEPSFPLETPEMENINLKEVGAAALLTGKNIEDKHFSFIQKSTEFSEGCKLSPSSDATNMDQKDKSGDPVRLVLSGRTQEQTERMLAPSVSCGSEAIQRSTELQNIKGCRISTELTLALDRNIGPGCWHHGDVPKLSSYSSLSGRESNHSLAGVDRSNWDLNAIMDEPGVSALVSSSDIVPCGNLISASRENAQMEAGRNLHVCLAIGLNRKKGINSPCRVKRDHADEPVDCCDGKAVNRTEKCESVDSLPFGSHIGDPKSIKVEKDCMNQAMNMMDEKSCCNQEMSNCSKLISKEAEAMQINGPLVVESRQSMLASFRGCSNDPLMENDDNLTGQSYHEPKGDTSNKSANSFLTNVATKGNELHTSRVMIMASTENNKWDDDMEIKGELPSAAKVAVKDNAEDSACYGEKNEISGCENSDSHNSNYESNRAPSVPEDHSESFDAQDDDYEDGEVREQLSFGISPAGKHSEQVGSAQDGASCDTGFPSTDNIISTCHASLAREEANVELQPTVPESDMNGCSKATAECTHNVDKDQSHSWELSLERVCSSPNCSFDQAESVEWNLTKHIQEEMDEPCLLSAVNTPSVTQPEIAERVLSDGTISIEGKEAGNPLPEMEALNNSKATFEDVYAEGSKRRVLAFSSLSSISSPNKSKLITNQPFQMRTVRKSLPDMALEVDRPHLRGRARVDKFEELSRGRNQSSFYRNSRLKFDQGSRIVSNSVIHNRDVKRDFSPELHNYPAKCRTTGCRYASGYRNSNLASEAQVCGDSCWVRRRLHGDESCFRRESSTRRSPARKDSHAHPMRILDHIPQDIGPVRWIDMDGYDMVHLRSNGNFRRDLCGDDFDSMFPCSRIPCDYDAGGVARGDRKLPSFEDGRGLVHSRSNFPMKRSRSPNQGSNRRRSPEGFGGHLELSRGRSPAVYRGNRVRSPERGCFRGKMMRRQSPPYLSQNLEESRRLCSGRRSLPDKDTFRIRRCGVNIRFESSKAYSKPHIGNLWSKGISQPGESNERSLNEERGHRRFTSHYDESNESDMCSSDEAAGAPCHLSPENRSWHREKGHSRGNKIDRTNNWSGHVQKS
ncbi:hypothetical protein MLD38_024180 [Melastoma candidum]|uniref:Uncharacterized protein n=1 Tax=Melastoma candidum TaxID=119954 RepID=A0ACB9NRV9_9MYRT|nr:hypothetical protein MLD38_024180 [Melastoma candidum]